MSESEAFTVITSSSHQTVFEDYEELFSAHGFSLFTAIQAALRRQYPEHNLTVTNNDNVPLLEFADSGHATAELDIKSDSIERLRFFSMGNVRSGTPDRLGDSKTFAKYQYQWAGEDYIVYMVFMGITVGVLNFILKKPGKDETTNSHCAATDALIFAVGQSYTYHDEKFIYVYDRYWIPSRSLWEEVQKARWEDVILDEQMKKDLTELVTKFFDSKQIYQELGVPWKRGVIFHGPAGNGKTISIKALMHSLTERRSSPSIASLYVKSADYKYEIRNIFVKAREMAPCMLIFEDIDTIVTDQTRSYFFNEVDGLENNNGIFMVASTNHLDRLDPGITKRPSRFDRKYLFPLPSEKERTMYCEYWREKLKNKPSIKFPKRLSPAIAGITQDFSFAYLKEAFVSTLLAIARHMSGETSNGDEDEDDNDDDDLDNYELWREMKKQVKLLREDMSHTQSSSSSSSSTYPTKPSATTATDASRRALPYHPRIFTPPGLLPKDKCRAFPSSISPSMPPSSLVQPQPQPQTQGLHSVLHTPGPSFHPEPAAHPTLSRMTADHQHHQHPFAIGRDGAVSVGKHGPSRVFDGGNV